MPERDLAALDGYQLIPRVLHQVTEPDMATVVLGRVLSVPMLPRSTSPVSGRAGMAGADQSPLVVVDADTLLRAKGDGNPGGSIAVLAPRKMADLVPEVRALAELGVACVGLDLAPLADSVPFGKAEFRPRSREDLAELRAAAGCPLWLFGVGGPGDAEIAAEAGVDGIVVSSEVGRRIGAPAVIDILPELLDAVAGMLTIAVSGPIRDGVDVLRYLAVGAELVVVDDDRALAAMAAELAYGLKLTGCATLADVSYDILFAPLFSEP
ncbi:MAG TPA: alpha-hydroxy-acid oxidizing protein [Trueperaceae bacterium]|nr:alpha-hydroxy-acid oxidizing protein [Trueperaceae bacterium]